MGTGVGVNVNIMVTLTFRRALCRHGVSTLMP
jgi:hypothetical protein